IDQTARHASGPVRLPVALLSQARPLSHWGLRQGRGLINSQPQPNRSKLDEGQVVGCELVVTCCNWATMLDFVEEPLHQIPSAVQIRAEAKCVFPVPFWRDIRPSAVLADKCPDPVGIISAVSQ